MQLATMIDVERDVEHKFQYIISIQVLFFHENTVKMHLSLSQEHKI